MYAGWFWPAECLVKPVNRKGSAYWGVYPPYTEVCSAITRLLQLSPNYFVLFLWICFLPDQLELYAIKLQSTVL